MFFDGGDEDKKNPKPDEGGSAAGDYESSHADADIAVPGDAPVGNMELGG